MKKAIKKTKTSAYVSPVGDFLAQLGCQYPKKSRSQQTERTTYERIFYLRDHKVERKPQLFKDPWSEF